MPDQLDDDSRIRITHGGPFHELMSALRLRKRGRRAFAFVCLAWAIPLLLACTAGDFQGAGQFLHDWGAYAKFLIAPALLTLSERPITFAVDECVSIFFRVPLYASQSKEDALRAIATARERTSAWVPELTCLALAAMASILSAAGMAETASPAWALSGSSLSTAGIWAVAVSNTLYWFLLARLIWKHMVWAGCLSELAACHLRLVVTHPDGHAGLGFLGLYPAGYVLFTFAVSSVAAAGVGHVIQNQAVTPGLFTIVCAIWLVIVAGYFALPLVSIASRLADLKRRTLLLSMAKATDFERWNERAIFGDNILDDEAEPEASEYHDVRPVWSAALKTSVLLLNRSNALPVLVPALLPMLAVGAFFLPYAQLWPMVKRLLLL
ncbi:hypothetical protein JNB91_29540 [Rhizobium wenxiniae]|uniref:hypothetical protein n=1 Tax=Rhizobium wenxiniae TaxID=1737357 RepID=UPI001C6F38EC|nr:hypothetical protein [Rhizobium wenxiniae]MBW9091917.1 hypothetical protein [Rhizobium wenxiniae]